MSHIATFPEMVTALRHLMGREDGGNDFTPPSLLKEVPSVTLPYSSYRKENAPYGELGGSAQRDSLGATEGSTFV